MNAATEDKELIAEAKAFANEVWEDVVNDIDLLVQVESVEDLSHAGEGMPFGPAPREALDRALGIAERLGLSSTNCEGYIGFADLVGKSKTYLATIAHADIVPLGTGWTVDPLHVTRKDGYLLGRGVIDDKGPLVLSLYAAHFFARKVRLTGEPLPYTLRCIVGSNEETGMKDIEYYLNNYPGPAFCFTPDASFPLICGEKGHFTAEIFWAGQKSDSTRIVSLEGGTVTNAVPGVARAVVRATAEDLVGTERIAVERCGANNKGDALCQITATGIGGHAAMPEKTLNAIGVLIEYLLENDLCNSEERSFLQFERILLADWQGRALGIAATDDLFDPLTCVGGTIRTQTDGSSYRFVQTMDVRYPKSTTGKKICARVAEVAAAHGCELGATDDAVPFYVAPDSREVDALVRTYNEISGRNGKAFTIGGGTYARHFARAVAFGPADEEVKDPSWVGMEHGADEGVLEDLLKNALVIYIVSIARLMRLNY